MKKPKEVKAKVQPDSKSEEKEQKEAHERYLEIMEEKRGKGWEKK